VHSKTPKLSGLRLHWGNGEGINAEPIYASEKKKGGGAALTLTLVRKRGKGRGPPPCLPRHREGEEPE